jgi:uracil-DNA glycosylase
MKKNNYADTVEKLQVFFKQSGWFDVFKTFLLSEDFVKIIVQLSDNVDDGLRFTPTLKQVFNAFIKCKYDTLKVVIIGKYPYESMGIADGMAYSCSNTGKPVLVLRNILNAVSKTVYPKETRQKNPNPDLSRWAEQGVLLLNLSLTTGIDKRNNHEKIWQPFTAFVIDTLSKKNPDLVWILLGNTCEIKDLISGDDLTILSGNSLGTPMNFSNWDCHDIFNRANVQLLKINKESIVW